MFDKFNKAKAFTLSEVLITLGIIGIIAAMTLPSLVGRYQEKVTVTRLKKYYSILSQAFERSVYDTQTNPKDWGMGDMYDAQSHINFANHFVPYLNISQNCVGKDNNYAMKHCFATGDNANPIYYAHVVLNDGTRVSFRLWWSDCQGKFGTSKPLESVCGSIGLDLNGNKAPNQLGQDRFDFYLTNLGVFPAGTQTETRLSFSTYCDKDAGWGTSIGGFGNGTGCTAWVLYNENMEYLRCSDLDWSGKNKCR